MKPFLKWAGNKYQIIERIKAILPVGKRLIEPFLGSGAVFLNTHYPDYLLADQNSDLIQLYLFLQKEQKDFIAYCRSFFRSENNCAENYYECRALFNSTTDNRLKSALFVYLNKHCFNGLCRYNSKGEFNTPFGQYKKPYFPEKEMQFFAMRTEKKVNFICADFLTVLQSAEKGDVVYCDPPYVPLSSTANFTNYNAREFKEAQQIKLAETAEMLAKKGATVIISNHVTELTNKIYRSARQMTFPVQRYISANGSQRKKVEEVLAVFG